MLLIGRGPGTDIVIPAPQVSARHAAIERLGRHRYLIRDLGSTNGTFLNDRQIREAEATPGDELRLGSLVFDWDRHLAALEADKPTRRASELGKAVTTSSRFRDYQELDVLGSGGMGRVYLARDRRFDRRVAIKVLRSDLVRDPQVVERFEAEATIQARLLHPNIVRVYELIRDRGRVAMVLEYVDGQSLEELIGSRGPLPLEIAIPLMRQMLAGVGYAHAHGLVHRDLKPSNILTRLEGDELIAKVTDFGIARILDLEKRRTETGTKMGTALYMSPEHVVNPKEADHASDIYSLGVSLYEMLSGVVPFDSDSYYELMRQIVEEPALPLVERTSGRIPAWLDEVVLRAVHKDTSVRFRSCEEFTHALAAGVEDSAEGPDPVTISRITPSGDSPVATKLDQALVAAVLRRNEAEVRRLLASGASPDARDEAGDRILLGALGKRFEPAGLRCHLQLKAAGAYRSLKAFYLLGTRALDWAALAVALPAALLWLLWLLRQGMRYPPPLSDAFWTWLLLSFCVFLLARVFGFLARVSSDFAKPR